MGERVWVERAECKTFVDNIQTAFKTKMPPKMSTGDGTVKSEQSTSAGKGQFLFHFFPCNQTDYKTFVDNIQTAFKISVSFRQLRGMEDYFPRGKPKHDQEIKI